MATKGSFKTGHPFVGKPRTVGVGAQTARLLVDEYRIALLEPAHPQILRELRLPAGTTWARVIALQRIKAAIMTDSRGTLAAKELREATEGKAVARFEVSQGEKVSFDFNVKFVQRKPPEMKTIEVIDVPQLPEAPPATIGDALGQIQEASQAQPIMVVDEEKKDG